MFRPVRTSAPSTSLFSLDEIKAHCRVDDSDSDDLLSALLQAATDHLDGWAGVLGRCLISQDWRQDYGDWQTCLRLPFPDVQTVTVKYFDTDNAEQTVSPALHELLEDARGSYVRFLDAFTYPSLYADRGDPVQVTMTAGYGVPADVPEALKRSALMLVSHWFENREAVADGSPAPMPMAVDALTAPYRRVRL